MGHLRDLLAHALEHREAACLVLHDTRSGLARLLTEGYRAALPGATFLDVDALPREAVLARVEALTPGDLVVLVESTRFTLKEHRFRVYLFNRGLKVAEHPHLARIPEVEFDTYVAALAYDPATLRPLGRALKARLDAAREVRLESALGQLIYPGPFEDAKLNIGDYAATRHVGGQFPIGEVFTEPVALEGVSGRVAVYGYGEADFSFRSVPEAFAVEVSAGRVVGAPGAPAGFQDVLEAIRREEGTVWVRELGFGLNRAFSKARPISDVGTFERACGVHLSLGARHAVYPKAGFDKKTAKYHVDIFCDLDAVRVDGEVVFADGDYCLPG